MINSTGVETGVTVNAIPATISGSRFTANHVPLTEGSNTLTITATDAYGLTATTTRSIIAQAGHYLRISSNIDSGTGPLDISFRINGSFSSATFARSASGPVPVTIISGTNPEEFSVRLVVEGTYTFNVSATAPDGQTYSDSVTVTVVNRNQLETLLKVKWEGINSKVSQGDITGALKYLRKGYRSYYQEFFSVLGNQLPQLAEGAPQLEFVYANDDRAKCRVFQHETVLGVPVTVGYPIFFEKEDGVWRLIQY